jgi:hypothetical protein
LPSSSGDGQPGPPNVPPDGSHSGGSGDRGVRRTGTIRVVSGAAGALALLLLALVLVGVFKTTHDHQTAAAMRRKNAALGVGATSSPRTSSAAAPEQSKPGSRLPDQSERILAALNDYWADIRDRDYIAAFGYFVPGALGLTESEFTSNQQRLGVSAVTFRGAVSASTPSSATVGVLSLVTHDREHGCRTWSGSYALVVEEGFWRILRAETTPKSC